MIHQIAHSTFTADTLEEFSKLKAILLNLPPSMKVSFDEIKRQAVVDIVESFEAK